MIGSAASSINCMLLGPQDGTFADDEVMRSYLQLLATEKNKVHAARPAKHTCANLCLPGRQVMCAGARGVDRAPQGTVEIDEAELPAACMQDVRKAVLHSLPTAECSLAEIMERTRDVNDEVRVPASHCHALATTRSRKCCAFVKFGHSSLLFR